MFIIKRLIFAFLFLCSFLLFCLFIQPFLQNYQLIIAINLDVIKGFFFIAFAVLLMSLFFTLFTVFTQDWHFLMIILPAISISSFLFFPYPVNIIFLICSCFIFSGMYFTIHRTLNSYVNFSPTALFVPLIKRTAILILLMSSLAFYATTAKTIQQKGFSLPDALISSVLQFIPSESLNPLENLNVSLTSQNSSLLTQNSELLSQFGLDPSILSQFAQSSQTDTKDILKQTLKKQIEQALNPFKYVLPFIFTFFFFMSVKPLESILSLVLPPTLWLFFWFFEKTKMITFTKEMREVKKLVV